MTQLLEITGVKWLTAKQLFNWYLRDSVRYDRRSGADVINACFTQKRLAEAAFAASKQTTADLALYQADDRKLDHLIERTRAEVLQLMINDGCKRKWIAIGRSHPDRGHAVVPAQYWPFLTIDMDSGSATGDGLAFREIRCVRIAAIPEKALTLLVEETISPAISPAVDAPSSTADEIRRTGAPGRPSSMDLIIAEFHKRCDTGVVQSTLIAEATHLKGWADAESITPPVTIKTIENRIRAPYRQAKSKQTEPPKL
jgi:hypothetical protein